LKKQKQPLAPPSLVSVREITVKSIASVTIIAAADRFFFFKKIPTISVTLILNLAIKEESLNNVSFKISSASL
jgi:hypothetical protein